MRSELKATVLPVVGEAQGRDCSRCQCVRSIAVDLAVHFVTVLGLSMLVWALPAYYYVAPLALVAPDWWQDLAREEGLREPLVHWVAGFLGI